MAKDNRTLGRFNLEGVMPAPRGVPQIEVTFDIDANGIVNVSAKDMATGKEQQITITASSGLSEGDIDKMVKEAESHKEDDETRRKEIDVRNRAEQLVYATEKTLAENKEQLPPNDMDAISSALAELKSAIESNDTDRIEREIENVTQLSHRLAETAYNQRQETAAADSPGSQSEETPWSRPRGENDDVIDAEFEETGT
jgi:molecular chaperone DnaK